MEAMKSSKLREIKDTVSDAAEIMQQIGNPGVLESLNKVKDTAKAVNEIIRGLSTSEMVKNIENFRLISENMNETSAKMENTVTQLRETGFMYETSELVKSAKEKINSFSIDDDPNNINGQDLRDVSIASKEMMLSIKDLVNEISLTMAYSKKSATINNVKDTIKEVSDVYTVAKEM